LSIPILPPSALKIAPSPTRENKKKIEEEEESKPQGKKNRIPLQLLADKMDCLCWPHLTLAEAI